MESQTTKQSDADKCGSATTTRICCMCLFLSTVYGDISETLKMIEWHWIVKTESMMKAIEVENPDTDEAHLISGLTCTHKIFNMFVIILPKLAISVLVFIYGGTFIALSPSNEEAFLNTLAGYFILEIDEILYNQFASAILVKAAGRVPPLKKETSAPMAMCSLLCCNIILMLVIFCCYLAINNFVCPDDQIEIYSQSSLTNISCNVHDNTSWIHSMSEGCTGMDAECARSNLWHC